MLFFGRSGGIFIVYIFKNEEKSSALDGKKLPALGKEIDRRENKHYGLKFECIFCFLIMFLRNRFAHLTERFHRLIKVVFLMEEKLL